MSLISSLAELGEGALELICPTRCVGCNLPGELLCPDCRAALPWIDQRWACPSCGAPFGWLTCTECRDQWEGASTVCALGFDAISSQLITVYKDQHELRLAPVLAAAMACALEEAAGCMGPDGAPRLMLEELDAICFVPATPAAYARRGFDHMEIVAGHLAGMLGLPLFDVLVRDSASDQRELGREERADNLRGTVGVIDDVGGMRLLVIDDVITTGSTIREAAGTLRAHGARGVQACALARVW